MPRLASSLATAPPMRFAPVISAARPVRSIFVLASGLLQPIAGTLRQPTLALPVKAPERPTLQYAAGMIGCRKVRAHAQQQAARENNNSTRVYPGGDHR